MKPKKKKKLPPPPPVKQEGAFNPLLHAASVLSRDAAQNADKPSGTADRRRPMPYNEKLKLAHTPEDFMWLGETQVGKVEEGGQGVATPVYRSSKL